MLSLKGTRMAAQERTDFSCLNAFHHLTQLFGQLGKLFSVECLGLPPHPRHSEWGTVIRKLDCLDLSLADQPRRLSGGCRARSARGQAGPTTCKLISRQSEDGKERMGKEDRGEMRGEP